MKNQKRKLWQNAVIYISLLCAIYGNGAVAFIAPSTISPTSSNNNSQRKLPNQFPSTLLTRPGSNAIRSDPPPIVAQSHLFQNDLCSASSVVPTRRKLFTQSRRVALLVALLVTSFSSRASASSSTIRQGVAALRSILPWKAAFRACMLVWSSSLIVSNNQVKKRQAKVATSEWSRYAQHPAARGRSIFWLILQQAVFILASKVLRFRKSEIRQHAGRHFADSLLKLGPLYIKLGQVVSCRKNLLGSEWIEAMSSLQDKVPANMGQDALDLAHTTMEGGKDEFDQLFSKFDATPLAAASLGQVHKAALRESGEVVAVKVQRPFLRTIYEQDMKLLSTIAQWMDQMPSNSKNVGGVASSWTKIFEDAGEILYREIDYRDEASNAVRFANDFGLTLGGKPIAPTAKSRNNQTLPSAADWIRTPYVYQNISNERLLVMEYVPSIKVTDKAKLDAANVTALDQLELADALARAYLRQFCCNLFFSTDPHPGNVGVEVMETGKPRLVLYDFGQAASLTQDQADGILQIMEAIVDMNVDRSIEAFQKMGVLVDGADLDKVRSKVAENYRTGKVKANRKSLRRKGYKFKDGDEAEEKVNGDSSSTGNLMEDRALVKGDKAAASAKDSEVMSFFSLPAEYAFVARAISQMDGVGKSLDPDFDFISNSAPYIVEIKGADKYLKEELTKFFNEVQGKITDFQTNKLPTMLAQKWNISPEGTTKR